MKSLFVFLALAALVSTITEACNPATWTRREKEIYHCMKRHGWSDKRLREFYNSVLKPGAGGRASCYTQSLVQGCIGAEDFIYYGVVVEDCTPSTPAPKIIYITVPVPVTAAPAPVTAASVPVTAAPAPVTAAPAGAIAPPGGIGNGVPAMKSPPGKGVTYVKQGGTDNRPPSG